MVRFRSRFGYPENCGDVFRLDGRQYRIRNSGAETIRLMVEFYDGATRMPDRNWAVRMRPEIRRAQALNARAVLSMIAETTNDSTIRILAIWLRGRCGGSLGTRSLAAFATHSDAVVRKEVARALKNMGAWSRLRPLATGDPAAKVRRIATMPPPKPLDQRVAYFLRRFPRESEVRPGSRGLFVAPGVDWTQRHAPKPRSLIRMILERIQRLVGNTL